MVCRRPENLVRYRSLCAMRRPEEEDLSPTMTDKNDELIPLETILLTEELDRRPLRQPDFEKENRALVALTKSLSDSPQTILQTLTDTILNICDCGSAGISLLTTHDGGKRFYWPAISGQWQAHIGGGTPRDFGPCGTVLDRNCPLLFTHVERVYTYFEPVTPSVEEALLVPFYVENKAVGTIWAVAHDHSHKFDAEDKRLLLSLGRFASAAYQALIPLDASRRWRPSSSPRTMPSSAKASTESSAVGIEAQSGYLATPLKKLSASTSHS